MDRERLVERVSLSTGKPQEYVSDVLETLVQVMLLTIADGEPVKLRALGEFNLRERPPRSQRLFGSDEPVEIAGKRYIHFRSSRSANAIVNED